MLNHFGVVVSCEHAGNLIPDDFRYLFSCNDAILQSHRGYDPGALELATHITERIKIPLFHTEISRLLIEANRSTHNPNLFSSLSKTLSQPVKNQILLKYYLPFREQVRHRIESLLDTNECVLHLSIHTFTPVLDGQVRNADIGLLYDPERKPDKDFCSYWRHQLLQNDQGLKIRMNYPYLGIADSHVNQLRKEYPVDRYISMELEVNQKFVLGDQQNWKNLQGVLVDTLLLVLYKEELIN